MRLDFTILWFENQFDEVRPAIRGLRDHLTDCGFNLVLIEASSAGELDEHARQQDMFHDIDLVVVDFDLGRQAEQGDAVAEEVRRRFGFTDIVFYSGVAPIGLRDRINARNVDGVFCMDRRELRVNLITLADNLVRRMSRLEGMRGLAVASAGRADAIMRDILAALHAGADEAGRHDIATFVDREVSDVQARLARLYGKAVGIEGKVESPACTSMVLLKSVKHFVQKGGPLSAERNVLSSYQDEVMLVRNDLGHATEVREDGGWAIHCRDGRRITVDDFPKFRGDFARHLANLEEIRTVLLRAVSKPNGESQQDLAERLGE